MAIYKDYSQEQLDLQYNNRHHVPDFKKYIDFWEQQSQLVLATLTSVKEIFYGDIQRETAAIFPSDHPASKTLVFIHGGYWQLFDKSKFYFIADAFADYGITVVIVNYPIAPAANLDSIVSSGKKAIKWLYDNIGQYNGNPEDMYIVGHSAGGHLASMLMFDNSNYLSNAIKGVCSLSGIFNLLPVQLSNLNTVLQLTNEVVKMYSPVYLTAIRHIPLLLFVGEQETNEFKSQSSDWYDFLKKQSVDVELLVLPGLNHFSILNSLAEKKSFLHQYVCKFMKIQIGGVKCTLKNRDT